MIAIVPVAITAPMILDSTVPEPHTAFGEIEWSSAGVWYDVGAQVVRAASHRKYRCIQAHFGAPSIIPETSTTYWEDIGPTNLWAVFDDLRSTRTMAAASPLELTIAPGVAVDCVAVSSLAADAVRILVASGRTEFDPPTQIYDSGTITLAERPYLSDSPSVVFRNLPEVADCEITVIITRAGTPECGSIVVGKEVFIGELREDAALDSQNYSQIERAADGSAVSIKKRRSVPKCMYKLSAEPQYANAILSAREKLNGIVTLWIPMEDDADGPYYDTTIIYGFPRRFFVSLKKSEVSVDLELEES